MHRTGNKCERIKIKKIKKADFKKVNYRKICFFLMQMRKFWLTGWMFYHFWSHYLNNILGNAWVQKWLLLQLINDSFNFPLRTYFFMLFSFLSFFILYWNHSSQVFVFFFFLFFVFVFFFYFFFFFFFFFLSYRSY